MGCRALCILDKNQLMLSLLNAICPQNNKSRTGNGILINISNDLCSITPLIKYQVVQKRIIMSTFHTGIRMNEDLNIRAEQQKNLLFNIKMKMAASANEFEQQMTTTNESVDPFLYLNGESLFDCQHSIALNLNIKKRDYSVFSYDEFKEKTIYEKKKKKKFFNKTKGKDLKIGFIKGLDDLIWQCLNSFDDARIRDELMQNIVIYGSDQNGICTVKNSKNIRLRLLNRLNAKLVDNDNKSVNVICLSEHAVDITYAAYLTQFSQFDRHWLTRAEYESDKHLKTMCYKKWNIDERSHRIFADLINSDTQFYESLLAATHHKSISISPLF